MIISILIGLAFSKKISMLGDLSITGELDCQGMDSDTLYSNGTVQTTSSLTANDITSDKITVSELTLSSISPINSQIIIDADVVIKAPPSTTSFIQLEWRILLHEDFEDVIDGWSHSQKSSCNNGRDYFLQGFAEQEISKVYKLPLHSKVRISASVHMIDLWQGESIFMKVNDHIVWVESAKSGNINICGNIEPDAGYAIPIDIVHKSSSQQLKISFGSSLTTKNASFGVDDVIIHIL